jgi:hypothetical protein
VGYWCPYRLEKTICKWDIYVPLVMKGLNGASVIHLTSFHDNFSISYVNKTGRRRVGLSVTCSDHVSRYCNGTAVHSPADRTLLSFNNAV